MDNSKNNVSNFYWPRRSKRLELIYSKSEILDKLQHFLDSDDTEGAADLHGFWDSVEPNENYISLVKNLLEQANSKYTAIDYLRSFTNTADKKWYNIKDLIKANRIVDPEPSDLDIDMIYRLEASKLSVPQLCSQFGVSKYLVRSVVRNYKANLKQIRRNNKRRLNKARKWNGHVVEKVKLFASQHSNKKFTLSDVQVSLLEQVPTPVKISKTTISNILRYRLNYRYKKMNLQNVSISRQVNKNRIIENVNLHRQLEDRQHKLIFIDEFKYSVRSNKHYGWAPKGKSGYLSLHLDNFSVNVMIAYSKEAIEGVIANKSTNDQHVFMMLLMEMDKNQPNNYAIIMDNASIHKTKNVRKLWDKLKILALTNDAYAPFLNPAEQLIMVIKTKLRKIHNSGQAMSLSKLKMVIDSISPSTLSSWIPQSRIEALNLLETWD